MPGCTETQWIEHCSSVYIHNKQVSLYFNNPIGRKIEEIYASIKDLNIIELGIQSSQIQEYQLVKLFSALDQLTVSEVPIRTSQLVQNYSDFKATEVTLVKILASNCKNFGIHEPSLSDKDLNLFMKHWVRGSNRRLEELYIQSYRESEDIVEAVFFQGIDCVETMDKSDGGVYYKIFEIPRHDGAIGRVKITEYCFSFSVIYDY